MFSLRLTCSKGRQCRVLRIWTAVSDKAQIAFRRHTSEHVVVAIVGALCERRASLCAPARGLFVVYHFLPRTRIVFRAGLSKAQRLLRRQANLPLSYRK